MTDQTTPDDVPADPDAAVFRSHAEPHDVRNPTPEAVFRGYTDGTDNHAPVPTPDAPAVEDDETAPTPETGTDTEGTSDDGQHDGQQHDGTDGDVAGSPADDSAGSPA